MFPPGNCTPVQYSIDTTTRASSALNCSISCRFFNTSHPLPPRPHLYRRFYVGLFLCWKQHEQLEGSMQKYQQLFRATAAAVEAAVGAVRGAALQYPQHPLHRAQLLAYLHLCSPPCTQQPWQQQRKHPLPLLRTRQNEHQITRQSQPTPIYQKWQQRQQ